MPEGYGRNGPDAGFWMTQIYQGIEFRKKYARERQWATWRQYYRGEWSPHVLPVNLFFTLLRTIVPRVYFRNPSVSVQPARPGFESMAFAKVLQRTDNRLMRQMDMKREMKRIVQDGFLFGTGFGKLGFGAEFTPTPEEGKTSEPISQRGERVEYRDRVLQNMPWFGRAHTGTVIVPDGIQIFEDARWVAHWIKRPLADIKADTRLTNTANLGPTGVQGTLSPGSGRYKWNVGTGSRKEYVEMADLVEIRDKKLSKVMVIAPQGNFGNRGDGRVLYFDDDEYLINGAFNFFPLIFNEDDEVFWGVPDSQILEPYQKEINEVRTQAMKQRRLALIRLLYDKNSIEAEDVQKMLSESVAAAIPVDAAEGDIRARVSTLQVGSVPIDVSRELAQIMQDVRETVGFSRNQMGEFNSRTADTTATEAEIVKAASEIRVDERRDLVADMLVDVVQNMHILMFNHWDVEEVVDVVGPGGVPIWVRFRPAMLATGHYNVKVDPDSSVPDTKQVREVRAAGVYNILKTNPLIDPLKLTAYLLNELHGVQFDDMMRMLPPIQNGMGTPGDPMSVGQFAGAIPAQMQQMQQASQARLRGGRTGGVRPERGTAGKPSRPALTSGTPRVR